MLSFPKWTKGTRGRGRWQRWLIFLFFQCLPPVLKQDPSKHVHTSIRGKGRGRRIKFCEIIFHFKEGSKMLKRVMYANETDSSSFYPFTTLFVCADLPVWHFMTLCGSTFFYLQHILTPSEGLELFEASNPSGFCISVTIKLGMWHGDESLHVLGRKKRK